LSDPQRNRAAFLDFVDLFYTQRNPKAALEKYVAEDYIQHNPALAQGRAAAIEFLTLLFSKPQARFTIKRMLVDGELAVVHVHGQPDPAQKGVAVADFYRFAEGKIVEHWDVIQPITDAAVNPLAFF